MEKRPGIITQARMGSTRLPGKVFSKIGNSALLDLHIQRLRKTGIEFAIATTENPIDDVFIHFGKREELNVYRGSEDNVLARFFETAEIFEFDPVIRVTSDCPLIDPGLIIRALEEHLSMHSEDVYTSNVVRRSFPRGFDLEVFSFALLKAAHERARSRVELEHVTPWIREHAETQHHVLNETDESSFRLTVDTQEDLELIRKLVLEHSAETLQAADIIRILHKFPELAAINAHIRQKGS